MPDRGPLLPRRDFLATGAAGLGALAFGPRWPGRDAWVRVLPPGPADMRWWREARFGMFVHWGLYAILGGEYGGRTDYGEWIRNNAHIPLAEYDRLVARFNPSAFDANRWAALAHEAGMGYLTITTKHHDGFALFDSALTDFCIRSTPFKRDIMHEVAVACRGHGVRPCWYHSIMDWHHPDYLPRRDWEAETRSAEGARYARYEAYLHGQVTELLTRYGDIGVMWFDGQWEGSWTQAMGQRLYEKCRALQPRVIVNNRINGWSAVPVPPEAQLGDFRTPEQEIPATGWPGVDWESCITMNRNWGYNSHDHDFKPVEQLIGMLVETASKGGNLLLNVGPRPDGSFPEESVERLRAMGRWMAVHGEAIHGTTASPFARASFRATSKPGRLYLFLGEWPGAELRVPGLRTPIRRATLLSDPGRGALACTAGPEGMTVELPGSPPEGPWPVVRLEFDGTPEVRE